MKKLQNDDWVNPAKISFVGGIEVEIGHNQIPGAASKKYWFPVICDGCTLRLTSTSRTLEDTAALKLELLNLINKELK